VDETPIRSQRPGKTDDITKMPHHRKSPEKFKKPNMLPGFQNAFMDSTPIRPSQRRVDKGKQRELEDVLADDLGVAGFLSPPTSPTRHPHETGIDIRMGDIDLFEESDPSVRYKDTLNPDMDIEMADEVHNLSEGTEDINMIEPFDWKTEVLLIFIYLFYSHTNNNFVQLNRIVLMHSLPSSTSLTFQTLLGVSVTSALPADLATTYSSACARVIEIVASTSKHTDFERAAEQVARSLVSMVPILNSTNSVSNLPCGSHQHSNQKQLLPLAALFNLLTMLVFVLPGFVSTLLSYVENTDKDNSQILVHVCEVILSQLDVSEEGQHREELGREIISLLQALSFNVNDDVVNKYVLLATGVHYAHIIL
jgi:hypothetical protein